MKNYLPNESDQESLTSGQILIYVDQNGEIAFGCDWDDSEEGIEAVAGMFFELKYKNLLQNMLTVLYKQCVVEDRVDVFNKILNSIHSKILDNTDENAIIVPPSTQGANYV